MHNIYIDHVSTIINIEMSGHLSIDELISFSTEINSLLSQLKANEYSMCCCFERLDPFSQDSLPYLIEIARNSLLKMRKIAAVHTRTITQIQFRRIETEANNDQHFDKKVMICRTRREAMDYLTEIN